jgi:hypothetical protein
MTWIDRLLVRLARLAIGLLNRRFSTAHRRVWWSNVSTYRARRVLFPGEVPQRWPADQEAAMIRIAFGEPGPRGMDSPPSPLLDITLTREMLDLFIDGAAETRNTQDVQLAALREQFPEAFAREA